MVVSSMVAGPVSWMGVVRRNELSEEIGSESWVNVGLPPAALLTH
jgi:hypothetical protein